MVNTINTRSYNMAKQQLSNDTLKALRDKLLKDANEAATSRNEMEFVPDVGKKTTVRFLPPKNPEDLFYWVHSYHYLPNVKKYLYTQHDYLVNGERMKDPIDVAVNSWYETAKTNKDDALYKIAGTLKRKKHYFFQVLIVDEPDPEKKFKILVDRSNDGKLARLICVKMGLPFFIDPSTKWVDKTSLDIDPDKRYFDLIDFENGHDFKIVKTQNGKETWDVSYADSFVIETPRALTDEEKKIVKASRIDLKEYIKAEEKYAVVKGALENFIESLGGDAPDSDEDDTASDVASSVDAEEEEVEEETPAPKAKAKKSAKNPVEDSSDEDIDEMLKEIE
jgi:hypothetical protein